MALDKEQRRMVNEAYDCAAELARNGKGRTDIQQALTERGLDAGTAEGIATRIIQEKSLEKRTAGMRNLIIGGLWCGGGVLATVITYTMAAAGGGGVYVVAWGAIVIGVIQMIRGLFQLMVG